MSLDRLHRPDISERYLPDWHLPRYDVESFIWVFAWILHHFGGKQLDKEERKWVDCPSMDAAFYNTDRKAARATKFQWVGQTRYVLHHTFHPLCPLLDQLLSLIRIGYAEATLMNLRIRANPNHDVDPQWYYTLGGNLEITKVIDIVTSFL